MSAIGEQPLSEVKTSRVSSARMKMMLGVAAEAGFPQRAQRRGRARRRDFMGGKGWGGPMA